MTSQRKYALIWLLLPLLVVRGLVPAGFMIDTSGDGLSMVICSGGLYKAVTLGDPGTVHVGEHNQKKHSDSICPFALAAVGASAPDALTVALTKFVAVAGSSAAIEFHFPFGPARAQQSRAPPAYS